ncbi:capsular polysaccharide synthesis protein [Hydrogenophaga sp.]|uniref:capsular polysaccharide synthesis protein n=1 Tax=Hydrogenophaga sp. TaxID=1904254 RepID=UPI0025C1D88C|nr:capsular polysaccharide synthesis protein [Hydrogenophaga sp.]
MSNLVFTYWEGQEYPFTRVCVDSVRRIFGNRHVHLTPLNISQWITLPKYVAVSDHILFRSDFIRAALMRRYGGWWFDSDVLLLKDPSKLVADGRPQIWNLIYKVDDAWIPLVNCGILYSKAESEWIVNIMSDFDCLNDIPSSITRENEDIGQDIFEKWSVGTGLCNIGHEHIFNSTVNVNADYRPFWNGVIGLDSVSYGLHIGASLSRWAMSDGDLQAKQTLEMSELRELLEKFPRSVISQYLCQLREG